LEPAGLEPGDDDAALLAAVRSGDAEALAALVRRHQTALYRAALQVVREPSDAQDVVQETFVRVYRGTAGFRGLGSVRAWLYRIAVNLAVDLLRRRRREMVGPVEESGDAAAADPLDEALRRERAAAVRRAVESLPPHYRLPLVLREWHDLSYEEIAAVLGIPVGTVRSRLHAGREALRRDLARMWRGEGDPS
jgi:RNA polymerase sigma-70 factor (ECF subfamily)